MYNHSSEVKKNANIRTLTCNANASERKEYTKNTKGYSIKLRASFDLSQKYH
jgi:hypothetical protein